MILTTLTIGCSDTVHLGWVRPSSLSCRTDYEAHTLCGAGGPMAGPPRPTDRGVTCQKCLQRAAAQRSAA